MSTERFEEIAEMAINMTEYLYLNEFTPEICEELQRNEAPKIKAYYEKINEELGISKKVKDIKICDWPYWHQPAASMYGPNIAVNHLLFEEGINNDTNDEWVSVRLDAPTWSLYQPLHEAVHVHLVTKKHDYFKGIEDGNIQKKCHLELA